MEQNTIHFVLDHVKPACFTGALRLRMLTPTGWDFCGEFYSFTAATNWAGSEASHLDADATVYMRVTQYQQTYEVQPLVDTLGRRQRGLYRTQAVSA